MYQRSLSGDLLPLLRVATQEVNASLHPATLVVTANGHLARFAQIRKLPSHGLSCTQLKPAAPILIPPSLYKLLCLFV